MTDPGVQVTLEMIGDELLKRVIQNLHAELHNHFTLELSASCATGFGHHQTSQVQPSVTLTVTMTSKRTQSKISSNAIILKVLPDTWGKPYLST